MGGQLGRIPSILSIQLGRIPSILSIPDTVSVRWYVWGCVCEVVCMGGQLGRIPSILSIPDTVSVRWYVWGDNSGGSRVYLVYNSGGSRV